MHSVYWRNKIMETMYQRGTNTFYIGLSGTTPSATGNNVTEPSGDGYRRVLIDAFEFIGDGAVANNEDIIFSRSTGVWFSPESPAICWVIFDGDNEASNVLTSGQLSKELVVGTNTSVVISKGDVSFVLLEDSSIQEDNP